MDTGPQEMERMAAAAFAALGNRTRLRVFKLLVRAGPEGANVGAIQHALGVPATTLAHHLAALARVGIIQQEKRGREVICVARYRTVDAMLEFMKSECCAGIDIRRRARSEVA